LSIKRYHAKSPNNCTLDIKFHTIVGNRIRLGGGIYSGSIDVHQCSDVQHLHCAEFTAI